MDVVSIVCDQDEREKTDMKHAHGSTAHILSLSLSHIDTYMCRSSCMNRGRDKTKVCLIHKIFFSMYHLDSIISENRSVHELRLHHHWHTHLNREMKMEPYRRRAQVRGPREDLRADRPRSLSMV